MPMPTLTTAPGRTVRPKRLTRNAAASMLGISLAGVRKLTDSGLLGSSTGIDRILVEKWQDRPELRVVSGAATILRTDSATAANDPGRAHKGFSTWMSDTEMTLGSLRWWRSDPEAVIQNEIFIGTISTIPYAVWRITECVDSQGIGTDRRYAYEGELLARYNGTSDCLIDQKMPEIARTIMQSRIYTNSGGPIAYLNESMK